MGQMVREGRFRGGKPPYGYRLEKLGRVTKKKREVFDLVVDEKEASVVRIIFDRYVNAGYGAQRIARYLFELGVTTHTGSYFTKTSVNRVLKNVIYTGVMKSGSVTTEVFPHLQIIQPELFQQVQEFMKQRTVKRGTIPLNMKGKSLLAGKIYCGECDSKLSMDMSKNRIHNEHGEPVLVTKMYYRCRCNELNPRLCMGQSVYGAERVDTTVEQTLVQLFKKFQLKSESAQVETQYQQQMSQCEAALRIAENNLKQKSDELQDYMNEVLKAIHGESSFSCDLLNELVAAAKQDIKILEQKRDQAKNAFNNSENILKELWERCHRVADWASRYEHAPLEERKMIVAQLLSKVSIWRGYHIEIDLNPIYRDFFGISQIKIPGFAEVSNAS